MFGIMTVSKMTKWRDAKSPNYYLNTDLKFPYSEVPYLGEFKLSQIPLTEGDLIEHVDYWGEGRVVAQDHVSGFSECYNINHQYRLVSTGPDAGRKIPNRIPVASKTECNTSSYIRGNSVKLVTVSGIFDKTCAKDIARLVNEKVGKVVVFSQDNNLEAVDTLIKELQAKTIINSHGNELPRKIRDQTIGSPFQIYLNATDLKEKLYNHIVNGDYDTAVTMTKTMQLRGNSVLLYETVAKLLEDGVKNIMGYAYKLWHGDSEDIVNNYFPKQFQLIFNEDAVKIVNKKDLMSLKLGEWISKGEKLAWGDGMGYTYERLRWMCIPVWVDNAVYFKIKNLEYNMYLKLIDAEINSFGDRKAWGSNDFDEKRNLFSLEPFTFKDEVLFYIVNREYNQALKLDVEKDSYGDRALWGHNGSAYDHPGYFGWYINIQ